MACGCAYQKTSRPSLFRSNRLSTAHLPQLLALSLEERRYLVVVGRIRQGCLYWTPRIGLQLLQRLQNNLRLSLRCAHNRGMYYQAGPGLILAEYKGARAQYCYFLAVRRTKRRPLPLAGAAASRVTAADSVMDLGSVSLGIRAFFLPSVMYGPNGPLTMDIPLFH